MNTHTYLNYDHLYNICSIPAESGPLYTVSTYHIKLWEAGANVDMQERGISLESSEFGPG